jgi:HD superfamily phosphodiesterase
VAPHVGIRVARGLAASLLCPELVEIFRSMTTATAFPRVLRWYALALFALAVGLASVFAIVGGFPETTAVVLLGGLYVFCHHRSVKLPTGVSVSPGLIVIMASLVVFQGEGRGLLAGAAVIGLLNGIDISCCNRRSWMWIVFNGGVTGVAVFAAALVFQPLPTDARMPWMLLEVVPPAVVFTAVAWSFIVLSYVIEQRRAPREVVEDLVPSFVQALPLALLGFFIGRLYLDLGPPVVLLIIVPILIAREMFASYMRVKESHEETVGMLVRALEAKDRYTAGHAERVATYAQYMGEELNFMPARLERLRFAALMHDIGKLVVPNHLLNKPGRLTSAEFAQVRMHEKVSVQMLSHIDFLRPIASAAHSDNTRFDPDDPDHPIESYIVMIADAYDAMTSTRAYRKALSQDVAFQELRDKAGVQFHPECVEAFIRSIESKGERHGAGFEAETEFESAPEAGLGSAGLGDLLPSETS